MRCSNCGWNNPEGSDKCQKCNQPLCGEEKPKSEMTDGSGTESALTCSNCGYVISAGIQKCPYCGASVNAGCESSDSEVRTDTSVESDISKTVPLSVSPAVQADGRKTVADISVIKSAIGSGTVMENPDSGSSKASGNGSDSRNAATDNAEPDKQNRYTYEFECIDAIRHGCVDIVSDVELPISAGDIILLAGLRYRKL